MKLRRGAFQRALLEGEKMKTSNWLVIGALFVLVATASVVAVGCSGSSGNEATPASNTPPVSGTTTPTIEPTVPKGKIKATRIEAQVEGDRVSISKSAVDAAWNAHFEISTADDTLPFMAYRLGDQTYVRASICPPCRSRSFTLDGNVLVCDACGTRFEAGTGKGISGPCKAYPKAAVAYSVDGGNIAMNLSDLVTAYENTTKPGLP